MIRHIVFWKLKDKTEDGTLLENAAAIKAGLEGLVGKIDGLESGGHREPDPR